MPLTRRSALLALGGATLTIPSFGGVEAQAAPIEATIAYGSTGYTWALSFVAEGIDSWKQEGVALTALDFPTGRESMQALLGGSAQFATSTDTPVIFAALQGLKPRILASYSRYSRDMKVTMSKASGASEKDPSSLKGKTIGTRVGTSGQYMLSRYLAMGGLQDSDVKIVDLNPSDMLAATLRGDVDGFAWTSQASKLALDAAPDKMFEMTQDGLEKFFVSHQLLLVNEGTLTGQPELGERAVRALLAAEDYMKKNDSWPEIVAPRVRAEADFVRRMTSVFEFQVRLDKAFLADLVSQAEWAINSGLAQAPAGDVRTLLSDLIVPEPLKKAAPDRVSL
jgi:ABC-type nitrate/sulfonate/bicarbonate transport system substrate-binding protein